MLASMEKLAIFKSGIQMQNIEVNIGLRGGDNRRANSLGLLGATQRLAIAVRPGELINRVGMTGGGPSVLPRTPLV